jgi:major capsid protein gp7
MPTGNTSLFDVVTRQYNDMLTGLVEDVTIYAPEFSEIPVVTRPGIQYKILKRTALPPAQFRIANKGVTPGKSAWKQDLKEMFYLDSPIVMDEMVRKGDDGSTGDLMAQEAQGVLQACVIYVGSQTYYGTTADANGFYGLRQQLSGIVGAGGTTSTNSAYLLWLNPHGVCYDVGRDGEISLPPPQRYPLPDPVTTGAYYFGWATNLSCFIGLSVKSLYSVWAVTGISGSGTTNAMTDANGAKLLALIPLVRRRGLKWFMNRQAHYTLQNSRTAIQYQPATAQGTPAWSPPPNAVEGYPIVVTDSIVSTENNT